jgi:hypothetical protein
MPRDTKTILSYLSDDFKNVWGKYISEHENNAEAAAKAIVEDMSKNVPGSLSPEVTKREVQKAYYDHNSDESIIEGYIKPKLVEMGIPAGAAKDLDERELSKMPLEQEIEYLYKYLNYQFYLDAYPKIKNRLSQFSQKLGPKMDEGLRKDIVSPEGITHDFKGPGMPYKSGSCSASRVVLNYMKNI